MYCITFIAGGIEKRDRVLPYLIGRINKSNRFRAEVFPFADKHNRPCIRIKTVRLTKKKSYCGNHPGECQVSPFGNRKKPVVSYLEWNDWVAFHSIVNKVLNRFRANAEVWSEPQDVKGKMWIRKGTKARLHYDWTEDCDSYGRIIRYWNQGTPDQFNK